MPFNFTRNTRIVFVNIKTYDSQILCGVQIMETVTNKKEFYKLIEPSGNNGIIIAI